MGKLLPKVLNIIVPNWFAKVKSKDHRSLPYNKRREAEEDGTHSTLIKSKSYDHKGNKPSSSTPTTNHGLNQSTSSSGHSLRKQNLSSPTLLQSNEKKEENGLTRKIHRRNIPSDDGKREEKGGGRAQEALHKSALSYRGKEHSSPSNESMEIAKINSITPFDLACQPLVKNSHCPYQDFRDSMKEAIALNNEHTRDCGQVMGHLLYCYFSLNDPCLYDIIESAFVDAYQDVFGTKK